MDNTKIVEMLRGLLLNPQTTAQVLLEVMELVDTKSRTKIRDYLRNKTIPALKQQRSAIEEAIRRYGAE